MPPPLDCAGGGAAVDAQQTTLGAGNQGLL